MATWLDGTRLLYPTGCPFCGDQNCPAFRQCRDRIESKELRRDGGLVGLRNQLLRWEAEHRDA